MRNLVTPLGLTGIGANSSAGQGRAPFFDWRVGAIALAVALAYYAGAKIGFALTVQPHPISVLWPPNSILLAALLLTPVRLWWVILLAAFPAHLAAQLQSSVPPTMILCWFVSNSCEALIGAGCVRYLVEYPVRFDRLRTVGVFCFFAALVGPFVSSFVDAGFVALNQWGQDSYWQVWRIRFTSNVLAALTLVPFIVTWCGEGIGWMRRIRRARFLEAALLLVALLSVNAIVFYKLGPIADFALVYLPLPFLLWATVRFGSRGTSAAICTVTFLAIWSAGHGYGPFSTRSAAENALSIQMFLIVMSVPLLLLAAVIEERRKGAMILHQRDERITLAAESANLAFWTIDYERQESWMNDQGRAMFDYGPDEFLTRERFLSRVHPDDREAVDEAIERARAKSPTFELEYRLLRPDGETRWLISRGRYVRDDRGAISELIGVAIDVTAQVKANLELRLQRVEMARMSRVSSMGELTASLAHELNQPLTAIASNAAAGRRMLAQGPPDHEMFKELLEDVSADARRAGDIIHGIHHFVRKSEGTRRPVNLNEIVREVLRLLHSDLLGRGTTVETELESSLPAVEADPIHLQQVLLNLLMNSLEAMQSTAAERRRVIICTKREGDAFVMVSVRDHGSGLPKDNLDKVFAHFYSTKPNGMGMGLTIVRSIVEAHGGKLSAENTDDGARFCFRLPLTPQSESVEVA
ncbi:MAG TPA: MASE1 domain-containing protein [Chthoniobacterales bacterium]|nr:MASE1 domain-containing protein [Chthoniobacterales bacterium]